MDLKEKEELAAKLSDATSALNRLSKDLLDLVQSLDRAAQLLRAPANADGAYCMCEKPLDDDGWRCIRCGKLLSPRHGG